MECLYDGTCEPMMLAETVHATRAPEFDCARGVFYGMIFVVPFWIAIIAAITAF
jgi:hypothetical protein